MTAADVRVPHARLIVVLAGVLVCSAILWLSRTYTFYFDEWTFISTAPDWTFSTFLLAAALSFSAIGVVFATAAGVQLLLTPARRRQLLWLAPVAVALVAWYVAFGRFGTHPNPQPTAANLLVDPLYVLWGLSQSVAGLIGEGGWVGVPLLAAGSIALAWSWKRHGRD